MLVRIVFGFIFESIPRSAATSAGGIAALDHKIGNDAMKHGAVVKLLFREKNEIVNGFRSVPGKEIANDFAELLAKRILRIERDLGPYKKP